MWLEATQPISDRAYQKRINHPGPRFFGAIFHPGPNHFFFSFWAIFIGGFHTIDSPKDVASIFGRYGDVDDERTGCPLRGGLVL